MRNIMLSMTALTLVVMLLPVGVTGQNINIDFQGDGTHGGVLNQEGPVDYVFLNGEIGNSVNVQSLNATGGAGNYSDYTSTPFSATGLVDTNGMTTGVAVTFTEGGVVGHAGTSATAVGLRSDYLVMFNSTDDTTYFGSAITGGSYDFQITGLNPSTPYRLGFVGGGDRNNANSVDFSFSTGETLSIQNADLPSNCVKLMSDASGVISGTAAYDTEKNQGHWGGMTIDELPSTQVRQFNLDIQGDGTSDFYQDTVPHPHGPDEYGEWNIMNLPALTSPTAVTVTDPSVVMSDSTGDSTDPVTFKMFGEVAGWTGSAGHHTLRGDYAIVHHGNFGLDPSYNFELTGLQPGADYMLTLIHGSPWAETRGVDVTADLDGDGQLDDETAVSVVALLPEYDVFFTANAEGKLIGQLAVEDSEGTWLHTEGDFAGLRLHQLTAVATIPGDTNADKIVDATDAAMVASNWGSPTGGGPAAGDFNNDGIVNAADASIMAANWGDHNEGVGEGNAVPEPSTIVLLLGMLLGVVVTRRKGR